MTPAQQDKMLENFNAHLIEDAEQRVKQEAALEQLQRIEAKVDMLVDKWQQVSGMKMLALALFFGVAPIIGGIMWVLDHFKR